LTTIIGAVVGSVAFLCLVAAIVGVVLFLRKKKKTVASPSGEMEMKVRAGKSDYGNLPNASNMYDVGAVQKVEPPIYDVGHLN
jgi:hypothetical protein